MHMLLLLWEIVGRGPWPCAVSPSPLLRIGHNGYAPGQRHGADSLQERGHEMDLGLTGKVALVPAASSGLGRAVALALAQPSR